MVSVEQVKLMALSLPDTKELPHFDIPSFRWRNKIFSTLRIAEQKVMVKLSPVDQSVFCAYNIDIFYPVPGAWGKKGYTYVDLKVVDPAMLSDAMQCAYDEVLRMYTAKGKKK